MAVRLSCYRHQTCLLLYVPAQLAMIVGELGRLLVLDNQTRNVHAGPRMRAQRGRNSGSIYQDQTFSCFTASLQHDGSLHSEIR